VSADPRPQPLRVPEPARWLLWLLFAGSTIAALNGLELASAPVFDRLLAALGVSLLLTSIGWFFVLALQCGLLWSIAMLIPYVNLIAISWFARRYWTVGAREPALVALGSVLAQLLLLFRWALDPPSGPVLY
jgi:hypothetical protein